MKQWLTITAVALFLAGVLLYSIYDRGYDKGYAKASDKAKKLLEKYEKENQRFKDSLQIVMDGLSDTILVLQNQKPKIIYKYKLVQQEIDSSIAQDSAKATDKYRIGLSELGVVPDQTPDLTYREIGFGAKFFSELMQKTELLAVSDHIQTEQQQQISTLSEAYKSSKREIELLKAKNQQEIEQLKTDKSFWEDRFPLTVGGGLGYDFNHKQVIPMVGVIWGIRIN